MKLSLPLLQKIQFRQIAKFGVVAAGVFAALCANAQTARIHSEVVNSDVAPVAGSLHPLARPEFDTGRLAADTRIGGIGIVFNRTPAQQAALDSLIAAQQDPASPLYHQWLTPEQFAARFGMAQADLDKVERWLEEQGFSIDSVATSRTLLRFSGTARQVELAFGTEMHTYNVRGEKHFAPSRQLSMPRVLASAVLAVSNLNDFRPKSHLVHGHNLRPRPNFTSGISGAVFFAPGDIATAYNIKAVYSSGVDGAGQTIAIVGQSEVTKTDIENFQKAAGFTVKDPTEIIVPGSGNATFFPGDESESDLDLEWSGSIAPGAGIYFIYTGSNTNFSAFDSIQYAVDNKIGTIISSSYGECEAFLGGANLESTFQQAAAQGQTVLAASGDDGSTDCYLGEGNTSAPLTEQQSIAVDYPASSPYVTGMGGTEVSGANSDYLTSGTAYWEASTGNDVISSLLQYLPEVAWNDDTPNCGVANCLSSSGGGASKLFEKPSWQAGVPGIPSDGKRDVPDLALYASPGFPGYLYCSSDSNAWTSGQVASCDNGFRDNSTGDLTVAGGTSFSAPIFAGVVALINQGAKYSTGQGVINSTLYELAGDSTTYASAFHDVTQGNNDCTAGSPFCAATTGFSAGTGYDQVTGLGSIDADSLLSAWPTSQTTLIATTTAITAASANPALNATDKFTITVTSNTGNTVPTGTVGITVDGSTLSQGLTLANGTATYSTSFTTAGTHTILASYAGDSTHAASTGTVSVTVSSGTTGPGTFALAATNVTVAQGSTGNSTITVTPKGGYTGTVLLTVDSSNDNALQNLCVNFTNMDSSGDGTVSISGASPVSTQLTLDTNASDCNGLGFARNGSGKVRLGSLHSMRSSTKNPPAHNEPSRAPLAAALAGVFLPGCLGRYSRRLRSLAGVIALAAVGFGLSACSSISSSIISDPPKGTYTITVTGQDSTSTTIPTATANFTFTIQ